MDEIAKEFYSQYGLAMNYVHVLETGILELYAIKIYVNDNITKKEYYEILSNPKKMTLGQINNKLFKLNFLSEDIKQSLITANKYRIFLCHRFWWEREIEFDNHKSLVILHQEILMFINHFNYLMQFIDKEINQIRKNHNLRIEEEMGLTNFRERERYIKNLIINKKNETNGN